MGRAEDLFEQLKGDGEAAIDRMIADRAAEELYLDFKRSAYAGAGQKLHQDDRKNLARAISGFGNSEGGVLIWGVECKDVATDKIPIDDPKLFVSRLESAVSGCTVPVHQTVRHWPIVSAGGTTGFAVTLIPKSDVAPHQALEPASPYYYIRAGSNFLPTPHAVLAGMFGRRPQARIWHNWSSYPVVYQPPSMKFDVNFQLMTGGPGVVRDLYLSIRLPAIYGGVGVGIKFLDPQNWTGHNAYKQIIGLVSKDGFKLAPGAVIAPITLVFTLAPPFLGPLSFEFKYGHAESPVNVVEAALEPAALQAAYDVIVTQLSSGAREVWPSSFVELLDPNTKYR